MGLESGRIIKMKVGPKPSISTFHFSDKNEVLIEVSELKSRKTAEEKVDPFDLREASGATRVPIAAMGGGASGSAEAEKAIISSSEPIMAEPISSLRPDAQIENQPEVVSIIYIYLVFFFFWVLNPAE